MFELASGNTRTIPASTLNEVFSLKRKGYLPAGLAKGMNNHTYNVADRKSQSIGQSLSDTIIYKGYTEYLAENGEPIIEDYSVDKLQGNDLVLPTYEASGYHNFQNVEDFTLVSPYYFNSKAYADWNNTTYLYLVWKKNPDSAYYNVWTANKGTPLEGQAQMPVGDVNFVTIPGDLNWLTYKTPKYIADDGSVKYFEKQSISMIASSRAIGVADYYYVVDKISSDKTNVNDFVIADRELPGSLWKTVYDWATADARGANKYDFGYIDESSSPSNSISYEDGYSVTPKVHKMATYNRYQGNGPRKETQTRVSTAFDPWFGAVYTGYTGTEADSYYGTSTYYRWRYGNRNDETHPVVNVNLYDAMLFCNALTEWYNYTQGENLTLAYGENRTYTDIKNNLESYIYDSVNKTGFRLPTYSEWFAAATIVPTVDNFTEAQGVGGLSLMDYASTTANAGTGNAMSQDRYDITKTGSNGKNYLKLERYWPPFVNRAITYKTYNQVLQYGSYTYQDTSFPFMQKLNGTVSGDNENYHYFGIDNGYKLAWYTGTEESEKSGPGRAGTKPVANKTSETSVVDPKTGALYEPSKFIPNSLGIWDMSGNAAEWIISPQESGTTYNVWLIGGDHQGGGSQCHI